MKRWLFVFIASMLVSITAVAAIDVFDFDNTEQEQQFQELSNTLRCPKCQNNSIADSNAALAQDLRKKVYDMTKEGKSKQEIVDYMIARYGNFVTYNPPLTLSTAVLWVAPLSVLVIGFAVIVFRSKRNKVVARKTEWDESKEERLKALLDDKENGDKQS